MQTTSAELFSSLTLCPGTSPYLLFSLESFTKNAWVLVKKLAVLLLLIRLHGWFLRAWSRNLILTENLMWVQGDAFCCPQETLCKLHTSQHRCVCSKNNFYAVCNGVFWAFWCCVCPPTFTEHRRAFGWFASRLATWAPYGLMGGTEAVRVHLSFAPLPTGLSVPVLRVALSRARLCHGSSWNRFFPSHPLGRPLFGRHSRANVCLAVPPATTALIAKWHLFQSQEKDEGILGFGTASSSRRSVWMPPANHAHRALFLCVGSYGR